MALSKNLLTVLLFLNCPFAFAGTGSAQDGYSIIYVLAGILVLIFGTPYLIRSSKRLWQFIKYKIERYFISIRSKNMNMLLSSHN